MALEARRRVDLVNPVVDGCRFNQLIMHETFDADDCTAALLNATALPLANAASMGILATLASNAAEVAQTVAHGNANRASDLLAYCNPNLSAVSRGVIDGRAHAFTLVDFQAVADNPLLPQVIRENALLHAAPALIAILDNGTHHPEILHQFSARISQLPSDQQLALAPHVAATGSNALVNQLNPAAAAEATRIVRHSRFGC